MKAYKGTRATAPPVLNIDTKQRRVFNCIQRPFYPQGKNSSTHWNRRLDGLQSRSVHFGVKSLAPVGIRAPNHSAGRLVAIPTKQSQLIKITQLHNTKITQLHNTKITQLHNTKITQLRNTKITQLRNTKITQLHNTKITQLHNTKITQLHYPKITQLHNTKITQLHNTKITQLHNTKITQLRNTKITQLHNTKITQLRNTKITQLHNTKIPSIYLESRHVLQKILLDIKSGLQFPPFLLFRTFIATIKIFTTLGSM